MIPLTDEIYIASHRGTVGSAIHRNLQAKGYSTIIVRTSKEPGPRKQQQVNDFFKQERSLYAFLAAAKVGGINAKMTGISSKVSISLPDETTTVYLEIKDRQWN